MTEDPVAKPAFDREWVTPHNPLFLFYIGMHVGGLPYTTTPPVRPSRETNLGRSLFFLQCPRYMDGIGIGGSSLSKMTEDPAAQSNFDREWVRQTTHSPFLFYNGVHAGDYRT
jgi:hypothetical protein